MDTVAGYEPYTVTIEPDLVLLDQRIISVNLKDRKGGTTPIRVRDEIESGRLKCIYHIGALFCNCIAHVIYNHWDASLLHDNTLVKIPIAESGDSVFATELTVNLSEERLAGGSRYATAELAINPSTTVVWTPGTYPLGYFMPEEGRFSLLQAFQVTCSDYVSLAREASTREPAASCGNKNHTYRAQEELRSNMRSVSRAIIEAAFLLIHGMCSHCFHSTQGGADVPSVTRR